MKRIEDIVLAAESKLRNAKPADASPASSHHQEPSPETPSDNAELDLTEEWEMELVEC